MRKTVSSVAALLTLMLAAVPGAGQSIVGRVLDAATGAPLPGAEVRLIDPAGAMEPRAVFADSLGLFRLVATLPGRYHIETVMLGYRTARSEPMEFRVGRELNVELRLDRDAIPLEPVRVVAERQTSIRLRDYYRRAEWSKNSGFGTVYTREDIERIRAPFTRLYAPNVHAVDGGRYVSMPRIDCVAATYLDGMEMPLEIIENSTQPDELEGVEIYKNLQVPPEFKRSPTSPCAVVLFWTRQDVARPLLTLPRIAAGAAAVLGILLLAR